MRDVWFSYRPLLRKYLWKTKAHTVLEWGTGKGAGTRFIKATVLEATVHTVEHDRTYYLLSKQNLKGLQGVHAHFARLHQNAYVNLPSTLNCKFDLVFVDGRDRAACLRKAPEYLADDGVVVLHDSQRARYRDAFYLYDVLEEKDFTAVLQPKRHQPQ